MTSYLAIKTLHVGCVALSGIGFVLRGMSLMFAPRWLALRWVRILPHVIDTILLASALGLVWLSAQYPFEQAWLTAKVMALIAYIVLGSIALKRGRSMPVRLGAWFAALAVFAYIVGVALARSPASWFA